MKSPTLSRLGAAALLCGALGLGTSACKDDQVPLENIPGHDQIPQDNSHKESPRLVPAEAYMRTYLRLFGGLTAIQSQQQLAAGGGGLFDNWNAYLGALGLPSYPQDLPRKGETNALMIATFERLGVALCDKALEKDLKSSPAVPAAERLIFTFDAPAKLDAAGFAERFDVLHRTFLAYPAKLAPTDRTARFYKLYQDAAAAQPKTGMRFTDVEAGWAAVCYGLVRHPEFHLY
jgi:hypothetical protein